MTSRILPGVLCVAFLMTGCVSQKKYNDLLGSKARTDRENLRLSKVEKDYLALQEEMAATQTTLQKTEDVMIQIKDKYLSLEETHNDLQRRFDRLQEDNRALLASASAEKQELTNQLEQKQTELDEQERALRRMRNTLEVREEELAAREQSIAELRDQLNRQQASLQQLKTSISEALLGFSAADLTVEQKNGKIYVSLSQNLLFEKNSNRVDKAGKEALAKLAEVLRNTDVAITVEGHTDSDGDPGFNWDLSVTRATAVVKELTKNGLPGERITASGKAFYLPIDTNANEQGKARNRRTEIILSPKLDRLLELIEQ
ncbi:MAG: OmpA family protein [Saprospiraceae bacterium]|nr:OmpA family protein [Saprospiraceae bacterium]